MAEVYSKEFYLSELKRSNLPLKKLSITPVIPKGDTEAYNKVISIGKDIVNFVRDGKNLLIWSNYPGTGKTLMATKIAQNYIHERNVPERATDCAFFINVGELLFYKKSAIDEISYKEKVRYCEEQIKKCKLVVWDDFGTKELSEYDREYLIVLLNFRLNELHKSNIYTTNLDGAQMFEILGARLASRLFEDTEVIEFKGGDKR